MSDWQDMRFLLAIDRTGSLAAAGQALGVDPTTVGRRLGGLERDVGARLVERRPDGCTLTEAGRLVRDAAEQMETTAHALDRQLAARASGVEGLVRVSTASGLVPMMTDALAALRRDHPGLSFAIDASMTLVNLVRREADVAVRMSPDSQPSLLVRKIGAAPWGVFASADYVERRGMPTSLDGHDVVAYAGVVGQSVPGRWLAARAERATVVLRTDDTLTARAAALSGLGVAALPEVVVAGQPSLRRVLPDVPHEASLYLVTHGELADVPRIRATLDHLAAFTPRWLADHRA